MAIVTLTCQGPAPASNALKALIQVLGLDNCTVAEAEVEVPPTVTVATVHALTGLTSTTVANTWLECCRAFCQQVPSAALFGTSIQEDALVTSWIQDAVESLVPVLLLAPSSVGEASSGECT